MSQQQNIDDKLNAVKTRIHHAEKLAGRQHGSVTLVGASKVQSAALIDSYAQQGLRDVGENYLQEAIEKQNTVSRPLNWHFIGQIQSNKTKLIAQHFSWVHGVDRVKIARRLGDQNPNPSTPINVLIQLNLDSEDSKGGVPLAQAPELADQIAQIDGIALQGFMAIPKARNNVSEQSAVFAQAYETLQSTNQRFGLQLDQLSMGMSGDLEAAVAEGSTMVRIGTDLFGARK